MTNEEDDPLGAADRLLSLREIAATLNDRLGQHITAYLINASDAQQIAAYTRGASVPDLHAQRLRTGFEVVRTLEASYDVPTAKAWLFGTNARLGDRAPIDAIAHATRTEQLVDVRRAACVFIDGEP